jgi:hypothetical protein
MVVLSVTQKNEYVKNTTMVVLSVTQQNEYVDNVSFAVIFGCSKA